MKATRRLIQLGAEIDAHLRHFEVDLGTKVEPYKPMMVPEGEQKPRVEYPCLYIYGRKDKGIFDLPTKGKAVVNYRIRGKTIRSDNDGEDRYSADIEIRSIDPVKAKPASKDKMDLAAIIASYTTDLSDGRARDRSGQYAAGDAPPRPEDIAAAYGAKKKKRTAIGIGAGAAAVAAGAAFPGSRRGVAKLGGAALRTITGMR